MYQVMIVDDDALMRKALKQIIEGNKNFQVVCEAANGEDAVSLCQEYEVNLIFMDIVMPQMNGIDATIAIQNQNKNISICMVSSFSNMDYMKRLFDCNIQKYFTKPISRKELESFLDSFQINGSKEISSDSSFFLEELQEKTFLETVEIIFQNVDQICDVDRYTVDHVYQQLISLGAGFFAMNSGLSQKDKLTERFPLQKEWIYNRELVKLWIFQAINYSWQQKSIQRYDILKPIFNYIELHIKENITLSDIVKNCMVSQGYLSRIFRNQYQISVMDYIRIRKIHMIKVNLLLSDLSAADIAEHLGFSDVKYMGKVFKKDVGLTISAYRKNFYNI